MPRLTALSTSGRRLDGKQLHFATRQPHLRARCNSAVQVKGSLRLLLILQLGSCPRGVERPRRVVRLCPASKEEPGVFLGPGHPDRLVLEAYTAVDVVYGLHASVTLATRC
jgi:hypothetical protein